MSAFATSDEGPAVGAAAGLLGTSDNGRADCACDDAHVKVRATMTAKLALLGYTLLELASGEFLVLRWDRTRHLSDLRAVSAFLRQIGGAR